jgi:hypothetical protein
MSWDELRTRVGQAGRKRLDLLAYRTRLQRLAHPLEPLPLRAKFFFNTGELGERVPLLREHLPEEVENTITEADAICRHEFNLLGYEKLNCGPDIDWHLDIVHGKRAPLKPWFNIRYLDFSEVGDHKVIWELNRHQHLVTLAKAWCLSGDSHYIHELLAQWYGWQKANPYPLGINWASTLEVAFRSLSWLWVRDLIAGCELPTPSFPRDLLSGLQLNGWYIERYLSTYFSPNTHLLGEGVALFYLGTLCPEIPAARRWQQTGWKIILQQAKRQVRADGLHFEQSLYYHVYALDFFLHARTLAALNGIPIPVEMDNVLRKMLDVIKVLAQSGCVEGAGDDDGGRVFNARRNRVQHMTDPLAIGTALYDTDEYAGVGQLTEEAVWLFGEKAVRRLAQKTAPLLPRSHAFVSAGLYLMGDDEPYAQQMVIDAGPQGTDNSGHGHADALSIRFSVEGQRVLIDPGTCAYISDGNERNLFRGTSAHNTLGVDKVDQALPIRPFAWASIPTVTPERWINGKGFDYFIGAHNGYGRLPDPVLHRRLVFHAKGGFWFVLDSAQGQQEHMLEIFWHFAPSLRLSKHDGVICARLPQSPDQTIPSSGVALLGCRNSAWNAELSSAFDSPVYGSKLIAPMACLKSRTVLPAESALLLVPLRAGAALGHFSESREAPCNLRAYRYDLPQSTRYLYLSEAGGSWTHGPWASDAQLLYCGLRDGRLKHMVMISGSFAQWQDQPLISVQGQVDHLERLDGNVYCSEDARVHYVADADHEFLHPVP